MVYILNVIICTNTLPSCREKNIYKFTCKYIYTNIHVFHNYNPVIHLNFTRDGLIDLKYNRNNNNLLLFIYYFFSL